MTQESKEDWHPSIWRNLRKNKTALIGLLYVGFIACLCFSAQWIAPYSYAEQNHYNTYSAPCHDHWLGTDSLGRDMLSRLLHGGKVSFTVAVFASLVSLSVGVAYGTIAGWFGGKVDRMMMRFVDVMYTLPLSLFVVILMVFLGRGLLPLLIAIGAVEWLTMSRMIRAQVMLLKRQPFVEASATLGQSVNGQIVKHVLPNLLTTIVVCLTLNIPYIILLESFISFLGLGVQAPLTSWGELIKEGAEAVERAPWLLIGPSFFFATTLLALNFIGDGIRDAVDPRIRST